jgi:hypothetical protein
VSGRAEVASTLQPYFPPSPENNRKHGVAKWGPFVRQRDGDHCAECGTTEDTTIDHIVPVWAGGRGVPENMQVLCRLHQQRKQARERPRYQHRVTIPHFSNKGRSEYVVNRRGDRGNLLDVQLRKVPSEMRPGRTQVLLTSRGGKWAWATYEGWSQTALRDPWVTFRLLMAPEPFETHPLATEFTGVQDGEDNRTARIAPRPQDRV